jgi:predicted nucleic acid-binding Zn ribbon protein
MELATSGSVIKKILYNIAGSQFKDLVTIALNWQLIVGSLLAERAIIQGYKNNTLYVAVNNSVWMQELVLQRRKIIKKIKKQLDIDILDIVYYIKSF